MMSVATGTEAKIDDPIEIAELSNVFEAEVAEMFAKFHGEVGWHGVGAAGAAGIVAKA